MNHSDEPTGSTAPEAESGSTPSRETRRAVGAARRFPAWLVLPLAAGAGFLTAGWPGFVLGAVLGVFLWRMRS